MANYQGGTGIVPEIEFALSIDAREYISNIVRSAGISFDSAPFFARLDGAARNFLGSAKLQRESGPVARHGNLLEAFKAASALSIALAGLDGNAKQVIRDVGGNAPLFDREVKNIVHRLKMAVATSSKSPAGKGRRLSQYHFEFAAEIESAFLDFSNHVPSGTVGGPLATVLAAVINEITNLKVGSSDKLAKAVAGRGIRVKEPDGVIWYRQVTESKKV